MSAALFTQDTTSQASVSKQQQAVPPHVDAIYSDYEPLTIAYDPPTPPAWARLTSLILIVLILIFTTATLGLEANMYKREKYWLDHKEPSDSDAVHFIVFLFIAVGFIDCIATIATLIVSCVTTVKEPRRVLGGPGSCGRNCFCVTVFFLACFSVVSISIFHWLQQVHSVEYPTPVAVPVVRTVLLFAYFIVLLVANCVRRDQ